jgi:hypothetical protein
VAMRSKWMHPIHLPPGYHLRNPAFSGLKQKSERFLVTRLSLGLEKNWDQETDSFWLAIARMF